MDDKEIIKALEICGTYKGKCTDCPAFVKVDRSNCKKVLLGAIDLINRQKAENERLKTNLNVELDNFASEYDDKIKAEAYKEFAERLKAEMKLWVYDFVSSPQRRFALQDIDNLLKELVGENK